MNEEVKERLGAAIDRVDNMANVLNIPFPAEFHVEEFKKILPGIVMELKESYTDLTGDNPWE